MINKFKAKDLKKLLLILLIILVFFYIIKISKLIGFCCTILNILSPLLIGYVIAWLIKPIMLKFNKRFNVVTSSIITYVLFTIIIGFIGYLFIPIVIKEIKNLIPQIIDFYNNLPNNIKDNIDLNKVGTKALSIINNCTNNLKTILLNIFYSLFISYFYLVRHKEVSKLISKYLPSKLTKDISLNLKGFVRGTIIDTIILFIITLISFYIIKMPYALLFAIIISLTNIIPYIGPYIGGVPAILVGLSISSKMALVVFIIIIISQFIESNIIHPLIMSKSMNISPLLIIIGIIVFGYFFGIIGMLISTPLVSIIKSCYEYYFLKKRIKKKELL